MRNVTLSPEHTFFRNESRLPLLPSFGGKIVQFGMVLTLFIPKIALVSMSLVHVPYCYPIGLFLEYVLIVAYHLAYNLAYNRRCLKSFDCEC